MKKEKTLKELLVEISGLVQNVEGKNYSVTHTPHSEIRFGGVSPSYNTGHTNRLEIEIINSNPTSPVKKLIFNGSSPLQNGQEIRAYVFKGYIEKLPYEEGPALTDRKTRKPKIFERDLKEEEIALYIQILESDGKRILRTDYGVDYEGINLS